MNSSLAANRCSRQVSALRPSNKGQLRRSIVARDRVPPDVPAPREGVEWVSSILSKFGPVKAKASKSYNLDFEKPLIELEQRIEQVGLRELSATGQISLTGR